MASESVLSGRSKPRALSQWSPTFLIPGTSFAEDSFSTDLGGEDGLGVIQVHYFYCALYYSLLLFSH